MGRQTRSVRSLRAKPVGLVFDALFPEQGASERSGARDEFTPGVIK